MQIKKLVIGILLIIMMFGHNFVLNQPQSMQQKITQIHSISVTSFNLLYSIPSAISILFIIPLGFYYQKYSNLLLIIGAITLSFGQFIIYLFGYQNLPFYYYYFMIGRVFEGIGAEILYMIQGNMASSWMGKYAGVVFILPEIGEIANVFVTPWSLQKYGVSKSFLIGFWTCFVSSISCFLIYYILKKKPSQTQLIQEQTSFQPARLSPQGGQSSSINKNEKTEVQSLQTIQISKPKNIFEASKVFWLMILLCGINECLYFPFLDNANELITKRFCIQYEKTGYYLCIPFISAMITSAISSKLLMKIERKKLMLIVSIIPLIGHGIIFLDENCTDIPTNIGQATLILGFSFFGMGIGTYYSISFPGVGLSVPRQIRGMAYACMGFFQTISMTLIPIFSGLIIQSDTTVLKLSQGYKNSSLLFVSICIAGIYVSYLIYKSANESSFIYDDEDNFDKQSQNEKFKLVELSSNSQKQR